MRAGRADNGSVHALERLADDALGLRLEPHAVAIII
jgi:hypothetical protein